MTLSVDIQHHFAGFDLDVSFEAPRGVTALFGRSGSGKTTVVNAVAGLLRPDAGRVVLNGQTLFDRSARTWIAPHLRQIGYVFQEGRLFPHLSVRQNLHYGRWFARRPHSDPDFARVVDLLGIEALLSRRPAMLSGGEKQRVAIGRALLSAPRLLLMDEPLAALDEERKLEILPYLERLRDETDVPIVYVSHTVAEIARLATTIVVLKDGAVLRCGPATDVLGDPAVSPALGVRGAGSVLSAEICAHHADGLTELMVGNGRLFLPRVASPIGTLVRVRVTAQDIMLALRRPDGISALNVLQGTVDDIHIQDGQSAMVVVAVGAQKLLAGITQRSCDALQLAPGTPCFAIMKSVAIAPDSIGKSETRVGPDGDA